VTKSGNARHQIYLAPGSFPQAGRANVEGLSVLEIDKQSPEAICEYTNKLPEVWN
jgi:hypothetical protein